MASKLLNATAALTINGRVFVSVTRRDAWSALEDLLPLIQEEMAKMEDFGDMRSLDALDPRLTVL